LFADPYHRRRASPPPANIVASPFPATNPQAETNCICESSGRWYSWRPVGGDAARATDASGCPNLRGSAINLRILSALNCAERGRPGAEIIRYWPNEWFIDRRSLSSVSARWWWRC
jgi:hypothetical protein